MSDLEQPIVAVRMTEGADNFLWEIDRNGTTRIEAYEEPGEYCMIPYIRIWRGDTKVMEACKHKFAAVYFGPKAD